MTKKTNDMDLLSAIDKFKSNSVRQKETGGIVSEETTRTSFDISKTKMQKLKIYLAKNNLSLRDFIMIHVDEAIKDID
ncbi:hypothetical protein D0T84_14450 [Dysgonomonas sp. 521]|uniref:hypothetical protein n=1 Tax=Dysgonomonas sp. 521 TaxID=2302932 RepID=UPI0013D133A7|nr:hypothetical protein [Dysgonomonas sp. 521]NDV96103.1 hypothetical protein [Dysgonomonas sp. 521]